MGVTVEYDYAGRLKEQRFVKGTDSPFTKPEMEAVDYGEPPMWIAVLGVFGFVAALVAWMFWWLA